MDKKNNLEEVRKEMGLMNRHFAKFIGINETMYSKLKSGLYPTGDKTINRIIKAFPKYNYKWVLFNEGEKENLSNNNNLIEEQMKPSTTDYREIAMQAMAQSMKEKDLRIEELETRLKEYESKVKESRTA